MGSFVNPGNAAFQVAVNSEIYVDKSGLIGYTNKVMNILQGHICNSRPRRFGKSITANMLTAYYSKGCDSKEMFENLEISQSPDFEIYLNQYDVIHWDIQWCIEPAGGPERVLDYITKRTIDELREYYPEEVLNHMKSLPEVLSYMNKISGRKFIIIIDEWDVLIRDEAANDRVQNEYINFLRGLFKGTEPTKYIHLAYLTGILPIKKLKTQSALNNFMQYSMLNPGPLASYIGFTEEDVYRLCKKYSRDYDETKRWYDGYRLGDYHIYNPNAVVNLMLEGTFQSYWSQTGTYESILPFINMNFDGLKTSVLMMLSGDFVTVRTSSFQNDMRSFKNKDDVLTLLIHLGYLAYDQTKQMALIPNEEIRREFANAVEENQWNELFKFQMASDELLEATLDMDADEVARTIEKIHTDFVSTIQYNNENSLSSVLSIAYLSAMKFYFKPVREWPTGRGFADFVFIPKPEYKLDYPALLVELKWNKNVKTAVQQIKDKNYPQSLLQYTGNILMVGISYDKKSKEHRCIIEAYEK